MHNLLLKMLQNIHGALYLDTLWRESFQRGPGLPSVHQRFIREGQKENPEWRGADRECCNRESEICPKRRKYTSRNLV